MTAIITQPAQTVCPSSWRVPIGGCSALTSPVTESHSSIAPTSSSATEAAR